MNEPANTPDMPPLPDAPVPPGDPAAADAPKDYSHLMKTKRRTLKLDGVETSIALEPVYWNYYDQRARAIGVHWSKLVAQALREVNVPSASRAAVLRVLTVYFLVGQRDELAAKTRAGQANTREPGVTHQDGSHELLDRPEAV